MSFTSKFFGSTSSSETDSEAEQIEKVIIKKKPVKTYLESSDEEDYVKRVIKSSQQKKKDEYSAITKKLKNSLKIKDFDSILNEFDQMHRVISKHCDIELPGPVVKALFETEELIKTSWDDKEYKSKLSKTKLKSLTTLKQKVKKNNLPYQDVIYKCRNSPDAYESDWKESDNEEFEAQQAALLASKKSAKQSGAQEFLKSDKAKESAQKRERKVKTVTKVSDDDVVTVKTTRQAKQLFGADEVINSESVYKKMQELSTQRGKKVSDKSILNMFIQLVNISNSAADVSVGLRAKLYTVIIALQLELFTNEPVMKHAHWLALKDNFQKLLHLVSSSDDITFNQDITEEEEKLINPPYIINGLFINYIFKIWDELKSIMLATDAYSFDYLDRMCDVAAFNQLLLELQTYVERRGTEIQICDIYMLRIEQIYYKMDHKWFISLKEQLNDEKTGISNPETSNKDQDESYSEKKVLNNLCQYIYLHGSEKLRYLAILCQVYHHSIHDRIHEARSLFHGSSIYGRVDLLDPQIKIYYNRALVQLGLCYFRKGRYQEALNMLKDISGNNLSRDLLAQGLSKATEKIQNRELSGRQLLIPFHMHVNMELVECACLICILVLEAAYSVSPCKKIRELFISRSLVSLVKNLEKSPLIGPPESLKEYIFASYKALCAGNSKACIDFLLQIRCLKLLINYDSVMKQLSCELKKSCIMAYLFKNCEIYVNMKLSSLVEKFDLSEKDIILTVNKMIINLKFPVRWSPGYSHLIFYHQMVPNPLSDLSITLMEKINILIEHDQRLDEVSSMLLATKEKPSSISSI